MEDGIMSKYINILKGVIISIIFTIISLFIFSIILTYTNVSESFIEPVVIITTVISIFIGSSIGNIKIKKNGMLNGALIGIIYLLGIYMMSSIINQNFSLNIQSIIIIITGTICGMLGGIVGVNKK